ncbi:hypothetical protein CY34DRAFT_273115 [Suillus luteus UH-Slu-Lm8-n1]|uniref:Uncharacterized protein n=1 Tax=Suillus luteus UH-Slu-Lm8-n1 TaxID=930992 RepID=A0A0D0AF87_9AGAM|nr:hypothetical protein CY34DRAFT_273115 [Suillus luteus UH-Slu-Lm8-n1]
MSQNHSKQCQRWRMHLLTFFLVSCLSRKSLLTHLIIITPYSTLRNAGPHSRLMVLFLHSPNHSLFHNNHTAWSPCLCSNRRRRMLNGRPLKLHGNTNFDASEGAFDYQQQNFLNFDLSAANNLGSMHDLERSLQAMLSSTGQNGVFNMANISPADILAQPEGELEVEMAPKPDAQSQELENYYNGFDFEAALATSEEHQPTTVNPSCTVNPADTVINTNLSVDDFTSFFKPNPDVQAYMEVQRLQRQPSAFTRDMMQFINFDAGEVGSQNAAAPQVGAPPPPPPQAQSPIFTQMTNTTAVPQSGYVPPAGAAHSSTRRVAASWKPNFAVSDDPAIDPALFY